MKYIYLPSDVIRIKEISAGVPIKAPVAPATIPRGMQKMFDSHMALSLGDYFHVKCFLPKPLQVYITCPTLLGF